MIIFLLSHKCHHFLQHLRIIPIQGSLCMISINNHLLLKWTMWACLVRIRSTEFLHKMKIQCILNLHIYFHKTMVNFLKCFPYQEPYLLVFSLSARYISKIHVISFSRLYIFILCIINSASQ